MHCSESKGTHRELHKCILKPRDIRFFYLFEAFFCRYSHRQIVKMSIIHFSRLETFWNRVFKEKAERGSGAAQVWKCSRCLHMKDEINCKRERTRVVFSDDLE